MTVLEIVKKLITEGYDIKYTVRKDGGILVTRVNEKKFTGASGNTFVRNIVGAELSEARKVQLKKIAPPKKVAPTSRKKEKLDDEILKAIRNTNAKLRRRSKKTGKNLGKVTRSNIRYRIEHEGKEAAMEAIRQANRYASGLAYDANIDALIGYINELANQITNASDFNAIEDLIERIENNRDKIREEDILPAYQALYLINDGYAVRDIVRMVIKELKI